MAPALAGVAALGLHAGLMLALSVAPRVLPGEGGARSFAVRLVSVVDAAPEVASAPPVEQRAREPDNTAPADRVVDRPPAPDQGQGLAFVDARWLSERPSPLGDIVIPTPESSVGGGPYRATLVLFIGRDGNVIKVEVENSNLPAEFESLARSAFASAKFRPGLVGSHAVRSKLAVEVGFESEAAAS